MKKLIIFATLLTTSYSVESKATNIVAFDVTAQVTQLSLPQPDLSIGDVFTMRLQYDADLANGVSTNDVATNFIAGNFNATYAYQTDHSFQVSVASNGVSYWAIGQTTPYLFGDGLGGPADDEFSNVYIDLYDSTGLNFVGPGVPESLDLSDFDTATLSFDTGFAGGVTFNAVVATIIGITPVQVPEPSTLLLAAVAGLGLILRQLRP